MPFFLLDTDHITHLRNGHPLVAARVRATPPDDIAACVISVEEQLDGWYRLLRQKQSRAKLADTYRRLGEAVTFSPTSASCRSPNWQSLDPRGCSRRG